MNSMSIFKLASVLLIVAVCTLVIYLDSTPKPTQTQAKQAKIEQQETRAEDIANYKSWMLVNPIPVKMDKATAKLCDDIRDEILRGKQSPHNDKYISVYVNDLGKKSMLEELDPEFPIGTIIVKEKLTKPDSKTPELLTVMVKHKDGLDKDNGDWEFLTFDGSATKKTKVDATSCRSCHSTYDYQDFVVRNYLPDEVRKKLK